MKSSHHGARKLVAALAVTTTLSLVAACGSSDEGNSGSGAEVDASGLREAEDLVAKYSARPTDVGIEEAVDAEIPTDKTLAWIDCGLPACTTIAGIIKTATDALGWEFTVIPTDGTPEKIKAAWQQVLRDKPDGVIYAAFDRALFEPELQEAAAAGIEVAAASGLDEPDDALDYVIGTPEQVDGWGELIAAYQIADSGGEADAVYVDLSAFQTLAGIKVRYSETMDELCPACEHDSIDLPITAVGKDAPNQIVSYLRAHPDVKYVALAADALGIGLPAAIKAAGLEGIKIVGEGADETSLQYVANGEEAATVAFPHYELNYAIVDHMVRKFSGVSTLDGSKMTIPTWLVTADNVPAGGEIFPVVEDVQNHYFKLWGIA